MENNQTEYDSLKSLVLRQDLKMQREVNITDVWWEGVPGVGAERLKAVDSMVVKLAGGTVRWMDEEVQ